MAKVEGDYYKHATPASDALFKGGALVMREIDANTVIVNGHTVTRQANGSFLVFTQCSVGSFIMRFLCFSPWPLAQLSL